MTEQRIVLGELPESMREITRQILEKKRRPTGAPRERRACVRNVPFARSDTTT
jgi:hypothetical protein